MEIKKDMVFEYVDGVYMKYFIPQKLQKNYWHGLILDENFNIISWDSHNKDRFNDKDVFKLAEKTLDTLWVGDMLEDERDNYTKVIQRTGNVVFLGSSTNDIESSMKDNDINDTYSIQELEGYGFTIVAEEEEVEELTMEDVCKELGRIIKIKK